MQDIVISVIANLISAINEIVHPISASCSAALPLFYLFQPQHPPSTASVPLRGSAAMSIRNIDHPVQLPLLPVTGVVVS